MSKYSKTIASYLKEDAGIQSLAANIPTKELPMGTKRKDEKKPVNYLKANADYQKSSDARLTCGIISKDDGIQTTLKKKLQGDKKKHHEPITHKAISKVMGFKEWKALK